MKNGGQNIWTLYLHEQDIKRQSRKEGRLEGEKMFATLIQKLLREGKSEELLEATKDEKVRAELYEKYDIKAEE